MPTGQQHVYKSLSYGHLMTCWSNLLVRRSEINSGFNYAGTPGKNSYARCEDPRCEPRVSCKCCYQTSWCVTDLNSQWEVNEAMDGKQADTVVRNSVSTKPQNVREREGKWRTCLCLTRTKTQGQRPYSLSFMVRYKLTHSLVPHSSPEQRVHTSKAFKFEKVLKAYESLFLLIIQDDSTSVCLGKPQPEGFILEDLTPDCWNQN